MVDRDSQIGHTPFSWTVWDKLNRQETRETLSGYNMQLCKYMELQLNSSINAMTCIYGLISVCMKCCNLTLDRLDVNMSWLLDKTAYEAKIHFLGNGQQKRCNHSANDIPLLVVISFECNHAQISKAMH